MRRQLVLVSVAHASQLSILGARSGRDMMGCQLVHLWPIEDLDVGFPTRAELRGRRRLFPSLSTIVPRHPRCAVTDDVWRREGRSIRH